MTTNKSPIESLKERLATSRYAARSDEIVGIVSGKGMLRAGVDVQVERATSTAPNGEKFHIAIHASTETISRDAGIVPVGAWESGGLAEFMKNPVILAFHDHKQLPVARAVHVELNSAKMDQYWQFHDETDLSRQVHALYDKGFMRAASVGFIVHEFQFVDELPKDDYEKLVTKYGASAMRDVIWVAKRAELLETSAVPVGSDPNALQFAAGMRSATAVGLDVSAIRLARGESPTDDPQQDEPMDPKDREALDNAAQKVTELSTKLTELSTTITTLSTKLEESASTVTKLTERVAALEEKAGKTVESSASGANDHISIEKRENESDEDALARYVEEQVRQRSGAPTTTAK